MLLCDAIVLCYPAMLYPDLMPSETHMHCYETHMHCYTLYRSAVPLSSALELKSGEPTRTVVELAMKFFGLAPDDQLKVVVQDALELVQQTGDAAYDLILMLFQLTAVVCEDSHANDDTDRHDGVQDEDENADNNNNRDNSSNKTTTTTRVTAAATTTWVIVPTMTTTAGGSD
eukprot:977057-Rhodomonas_salina.1